MEIKIEPKEDYYEMYVDGKYIGLTYNPKRVDELVKLYLKDPKAVKKCTHCDVTRHIIMFYKNSNSPDGMHSWCKICNHNWEPPVM